MASSARVARVVATLVAVATAGMVIISLLVWLAGGLQTLPVSFGRSALGIGGLVVAPIAYLAMGAILASRIPRNPIGWLFLAAGVALGTMLPVNLLVASVHHALRPASPEVIAVAWLRNTFATPTVVAVLVLAGGLFPTGRPVTARWRVFVWGTLVAWVMLAAAAALDPAGLVSYPSIPNPTAADRDLTPVVSAIRLIGVALLVGCTGAAVASLWVRYRDGGGIVRAQLRWVLVAAGISAVATAPFLVTRYLVPVPESWGEHLAAAAQLGSSTFPVATAIAISRYRLFDIDVLLGRTLVYLPLTAILGGLYTAAIAFFQRLFVALTGETSDTAIVLTVLVVAAAFTPARKALESIVERRFRVPEAAAGVPATGVPIISEQGDPVPIANPGRALEPSVLLPVATSGSVKCPIYGVRDVSACLRCSYLRAIVTGPEAAVVCSPPTGSRSSALQAVSRREAP